MSARRAFCSRLGLVLVLGLVIASVSAQETGETEAGAEAAADTTEEASPPVQIRSPLDGLSRPATPSRLRLQWLSDELTPAQVRWLNGDQQNPSAFLALYLPETTGRGQGGALILPDAGQHPDWPGVVSVLRQGLPDKGWHTLSIAPYSQNQQTGISRVLETRTSDQFPYPDAPVRRRVGGDPANAETGDEAGTGEAGAAEESAADDKTAETDPNAEARAATNAETEKLEAEAAAESARAAGEPEVALNESLSPQAAEVSPVTRLELGLQFLNQSGLLNQVIIGVGRGAETTLDYLEALPTIPEKGLVLVWINAEVDDQRLNQLLERQPDMLSLQILDIYDGQNREWQDRAQFRLRFARRKQMTGYQQVRLPWLERAVSGYDQMLVERISGWLQRAAPGEDRARQNL